MWNDSYLKLNIIANEQKNDVLTDWMKLIICNSQAEICSEVLVITQFPKNVILMKAMSYYKYIRVCQKDFQLCEG